MPVGDDSAASRWSARRRPGGSVGDRDPRTMANLIAMVGGMWHMHARRTSLTEFGGVRDDRARDAKFKERSAVPGTGPGGRPQLER